MAMGAEKLLQIIVGTREVRHVIARKETGPGALRHVADVREPGSQRGTAQLLVTRHGPAQGPQVALDASAIALWGMGEYLGCTFDPARGHAYQRPKLSRLV